MRVEASRPGGADGHVHPPKTSAENRRDQRVCTITGGNRKVHAEVHAEVDGCARDTAEAATRCVVWTSAVPALANGRRLGSIQRTSRAPRGPRERPPVRGGGFRASRLQTDCAHGSVRTVAENGAERREGDAKEGTTMQQKPVAAGRISCLGLPKSKPPAMSRAILSPRFPIPT